MLACFRSGVYLSPGRLFYSTVLRSTLLHPTYLTLFCSALLYFFPTLPYSVLLCMLYSTSVPLYLTLFCSVALLYFYPTLPYSVLLHFTILYSAIPYSALLDSTLLYSALFYFIFSLFYHTLVFSFFFVFGSLPPLCARSRVRFPAGAAGEKNFFSTLSSLCWL